MKSIIRSVFAISFLLSQTFNPAPVLAAGIPVLDAIGQLQRQLIQLESIAHTGLLETQVAQQVQQLTQQAQQLENDYQTLRQLGQYDWTSYNDIIAGLAHATQYANRLSARESATLEAWTDYKTLNEFIQGGNFSEEFKNWHARVSNDTMNMVRAHAEKNNLHAKQILKDAELIGKLNAATQNATGEVQAIQSIGQHQSMTNKLLLDTKQLLIQEQQRELQKRAEEAEEKAMNKALFDKATIYTPTTDHKGF